MTLEEAFKKLEHRPRRHCWPPGRYMNSKYPLSQLTIEDLFADDYELEPLPKKKKTVWIAVSPACTRGAHPTSYAKHTPTEVFSSDAWPVYELEIEVEE